MINLTVWVLLMPLLGFIILGCSWKGSPTSGRDHRGLGLLWPGFYFCRLQLLLAAGHAGQCGAQATRYSTPGSPREIFK